MKHRSASVSFLLVVGLGAALALAAGAVIVHGLRTPLVAVVGHQPHEVWPMLPTFPANLPDMVGATPRFLPMLAAELPPGWPRNSGTKCLIVCVNERCGPCPPALPGARP